MKKYVQVFSIGIKDMLTYRFDVFGRGISCFFKICIAYFMWNIIYSMNNVVSGYTFNEMITYYLLINFFLSFEKSSEVSKLMSGEIKSGNFTKYIVKPVNFMGYYFSLIFSRVTYSVVINIVSLGVWLIVFHSFFQIHISLYILLNSILIILLGLFFVALLNYLFMILTFWVIDSTAFFMIKDNIVDFVTGALVPLSLLPASIVAIFKYTPFYYMFYYPVRICINGDLSQLGTGFCVLTASCIILLCLDQLLYRHAVKLYEGVGI